MCKKEKKRLQLENGGLEKVKKKQHNDNADLNLDREKKTQPNSVTVEVVSVWGNRGCRFVFELFICANVFV